MSGRAALLLFALLLASGCTGSSDGGGSGGGGAGGSGASGGAGGGSGGSGASAGATGQCFDDAGTFQEYTEKTCGSATDCVIAEHVKDCCGTIQYVGVTQSELATFNACEDAWRKSLPACPCHPTVSYVEQPSDGTVDAGAADAVKVQCIDCTMSSCMCITTLQ